jgi:hypothetical protein
MVRVWPLCFQRGFTPSHAAVTDTGGFAVFTVMMTGPTRGISSIAPLSGWFGMPLARLTR